MEIVYVKCGLCKLDFRTTKAALKECDPGARLGFVFRSSIPAEDGSTTVVRISVLNTGNDICPKCSVAYLRIACENANKNALKMMNSTILSFKGLI